MKILLIGMDGVEAATFKRGWTPYLESLLSIGNPLSLKEDLLSRGWSEIVTGEHALTTGALYERPLIDGSYGWTESFQLKDVPNLGGSVKPIWQVLNEQGFKVGIMNVPTTFPAPEVDGFFVSGGGGGGPVSQDVTSEQCHPGDVYSYLAEMGYIVDERFGSLLGEKKLYEPKSFFERIKKKVEKRTEAFITLAQEKEVDFGFLVYKSATVGTESILIPEIEKKKKGGEWNRDIYNSAKDFYVFLERQIKKLIENFPEAIVVLVSDHSTVLRRYAVNPNIFLIENGYQKASSARKGTYDFIKKFKHIIPLPIRSVLKNNNKIRRSYESMITFDPKSTTAFCISFSNGAHGIYINDKVRFGGPISPDDVEKIAGRIAEDFNNHEISIKHCFKARWKGRHGQGKESQYPDVILDLPDGYQTNNITNEFLSEAVLPEREMDLYDAEKDLRLTGKGHYPLATIINSSWPLTATQDSDLTLIYRNILEIMR